MPHEQTIGKPYAGNPHVRFERGPQETEPARHRAWGLPMDEKQLKGLRRSAAGIISGSIFGLFFAYGPFKYDPRLQIAAWIFVGFAAVYACLMVALHVQARKHR
jgi:hypothetical protein